MKKALIYFLILYSSISIINAQPSCCSEVEATASATTICIGESTQLNAVNTNCGEFPNFTWIPTTGLNNPNIINPIASPTQTTTYFLRFSSESCPSQVVDFITITVEDFTAPTFNIENEYCQGESPDNLPSFSTNGFQGIWFPNSISTTTTGTSSYTFSPLQGECATTFQLQVNVVAMEVPNFNVNTNYCIGASGDPLPSSSSNGINGSWDPTAIVTSTIGTAIYTFTPNENECATSIEIEVSVSPEEIPMFNLTTDYCDGDTPDLLPLTSNNGINGVWNPSAILTSTIGSTVYTFTPNSNECASLIELIVEVLQLETPTFNITSFYCEETMADELPSASQNGISGTWEPQIITTSLLGEETYIFTPANDECAEIYELLVTITEKDIPVFDFSTEFCIGDMPDPLPGISINGISGGWIPTTINTTTAGVADYVFIPDSDLCAIEETISITITQCACADPPTANAGPNQTICKDEIVSLFGQIGGTASNVNWTTEGSGTFDDPTLLDATYSPSTSDIAIGSVDLTLTTNDPDGDGPCKEANDRINIIINNLQANAGIDQIVCFGEPTLLCADSMPNTSFLWSTGANSRCIEVSLVESTSLSVEMTIEDCITADEVMITVSPEILVEIIDQNTVNISGGTPPYQDSIFITNNLITAIIVDANGCTASDTLAISTSLERQSLSKEVKIYPNPTSDKINIDYQKSDQSEFYIRIFSSNGKIIRELIGRPTSVDLSEVEVGLYQVQMIQKDNSIIIPIIKLN